VKLIDFCCKAGGTSMGYHQAGFEVVGVDVEDQPNYPFEFRRLDVREITASEIAEIAREFDAVAISPPCQTHSTLKTCAVPGRYDDLIPFARKLVSDIGLPYIIENVPGAPLVNPVRLCGSSFGLRIRRHRIFESSVALVGKPCEHGWQERSKIYINRPHGDGSEKRVGFIPKGNGPFWLPRMKRYVPSVQLQRVAMGIDWMTGDELEEAIPPAYTRYLGEQLIKRMER
jgi:DNA (cytosine-5)-methyltransferase 1